MQPARYQRRTIRRHRNIGCRMQSLELVLRIAATQSLTDADQPCQIPTIATGGDEVGRSRHFSISGDGMIEDDPFRSRSDKHLSSGSINHEYGGNFPAISNSRIVIVGIAFRFALDTLHVMIRQRWRGYDRRKTDQSPVLWRYRMLCVHP